MNRKIKASLTLEQIKNLQTLSTYLKQPILKAGFDMGVWWTDEADHPCGSAGCALGHGPLAGIPTPDSEDWITYAERCFTGIECHNDIYLWLFSSDWEDTDNTPQGAAARIDYLLEKGLPDNLIEQMEGRETLCYKI